MNYFHEIYLEYVESETQKFTKRMATYAQEKY